jgi:hypothetical protein
MQYYFYHDDSNRCAALTTDPTGGNLSMPARDFTGSWHYARSIHSSDLAAVTFLKDAPQRIASDGFLLLSESDIAFHE